MLIALRLLIVLSVLSAVKALVKNRGSYMKLHEIVTTPEGSLKLIRLIRM